ncbi:MAG: hypothetical protein HDR09_02835 [Lachnospiraceae bacterium]|nr:hypothetical protein [Lachnospiraceae bacterium]
MAIKLYEVNPQYIDYLVPHAPHLFQNKQPGQHNERKYIGIVLNVNNMNYFAPLSSPYSQVFFSINSILFDTCS